MKERKKKMINKRSKKGTFTATPPNGAGERKYFDLAPVSCYFVFFHSFFAASHSNVPHSLQGARHDVLNVYKIRKYITGSVAIHGGSEKHVIGT